MSHGGGGDDARKHRHKAAASSSPTVVAGDLKRRRRRQRAKFNLAALSAAARWTTVILSVSLCARALVFIHFAARVFAPRLAAACTQDAALYSERALAFWLVSPVRILCLFCPASRQRRWRRPLVEARARMRVVIWRRSLLYCTTRARAREQEIVRRLFCTRRALNNRGACRRRSRQNSSLQHGFASRRPHSAFALPHPHLHRPLGDTHILFSRKIRAKRRDNVDHEVGGQKKRASL